MIMRSLYKAMPLCFLLLSCSLFPQPTGTVDKYILTKPTVQKSLRIAEKDIFVVQPSLAVVLQDHSRIVYYPTPQKIEYLAGGEWAQKLDLMVWESLFEALKASHKFKAVLLDAAPPESLTLKTHIAMLGIEQDGSNKKVHAVYEFSLFGLENKLISQKRIEKTITLSDSKLDAVVSCLNAAHQKIIMEYVNEVSV